MNVKMPIVPEKPVLGRVIKMLEESAKKMERLERMSAWEILKSGGEEKAEGRS